jgi:CheY-like chemotaxis protein
MNFIQEDQKLVVFSDYNRIRQILTNLIDNAIKFTSKGIIEMTVIADENNIRWIVKDTGRGIPPELQDMVFDRFKQASENQQTKNNLGHGLGLNIARSLAELLGGNLSLKSEPGKGSEFTLTIPKVATKTAPIEIKNLSIGTEYNWSEKTILIAEDEENNFIFLKTAIRSTGAKLIRAVNGQEVINKIRSSPEVSLVLMDLKMPVMSGYEAQKVIQKEYPHIPVVAQTAYAMQGEREKCMEAGFAWYLSKPIKKTDLLNCLSILLK